MGYFEIFEDLGVKWKKKLVFKQVNPNLGHQSPSPSLYLVLAAQSAPRGTFPLSLSSPLISLSLTKLSLSTFPLLDKIIMEEHIIKVCATELTFKNFTWKSHFHNQYYLKDYESCIYQSKRKQETYPESLSNLGFFKFLGFHNQKSFVLFSLISKCFEWVDTFLILMSVFRWKKI